MNLNEFIKRWKSGIMSITPYQQSVIQIRGQIISLVGVLIGIFMAIKLKYLWLVIILGGALIVTLSQMIGIYQKINLLREIETNFVSENIQELKGDELKNEQKSAD